MMIDLQTAKRIQMTATCSKCGEQIPVREYFTDKYGSTYRGLCKKCDIDIRVVTRINGHLYNSLEKRIEKREQERQSTPQTGSLSHPKSGTTEINQPYRPGGLVTCFGDRR